VGEVGEELVLEPAGVDRKVNPDKFPEAGFNIRGATEGVGSLRVVESTWVKRGATPMWPEVADKSKSLVGVKSKLGGEKELESRLSAGEVGLASGVSLFIRFGVEMCLSIESFVLAEKLIIICP